MSKHDSDSAARGKRPYKGSDSLNTEPHVSTGTLTGSAVANVLKSVLEERKSGVQSLVGATLDGRYRIEKLIGEGGMGMVYLAQHIVIEKKVAIKVLRAEVAADEAVSKRFVQEARAASRIGHPNIVDVTDFGTTKDGLTYQVMEFLEGQTLTNLIRKVQPLPLARALGVVAQMARALGAAHKKGIVHRDLKPDNIFLVRRDGREDFVKIVDFGIAKVAPKSDDSNEARLTQVGTVFGTPEYMSPEQASGRTDVDLRADIYAVGTILYEMLVGSVPHKGETTVRTLAMQILDDPRRPREARPDLDISQDLEDVVMRALEKNRDRRYQTMEELLDALEEVTSKTELDLPLLLKQERISANVIRQNQYDTVPDVEGHEHLEDQEAGEHDDPSEAAITTVRQVERAARSTKARRNRRSSRVTDPAFLRRGSSASVPIFEPIEPEDTEPIEDSGSKLGIVLLALLLVGGVVGAFVLIRGKQDSSPVASAPIDAAPRPLLQQPVDASPNPPVVDAGSVALVPPDAQVSRGKKPRNHSTEVDVRPTTPIDAPVGDETLEVTIVTKPRGGRLIIKNEYAGSDGLNLHRKVGTKETVQCRLKGYSDGSVDVYFNGMQELYLCKMRKVRTKRCIEGVKNPFDDCP